MALASTSTVPTAKWHLLRVGEEFKGSVLEEMCVGLAPWGPHSMGARLGLCTSLQPWGAMAARPWLCQGWLSTTALW